jgi:two-component system alkaline phosphatase synthesis response regulator PhoP
VTDRVLIIDSDEEAALELSETLRREGYSVEIAADGIAGLAKATSDRFELVMLDADLPGRDGFEVCRILRRCRILAPILSLSSRNDVIDRVRGLKLGADDYVSKSCATAELLARIEALLRRVGRDPAIPVEGFRFGAIAVDFDKNCLRKNGSRVGLAGKELELLRYLILHRGRVITRNELLEAVWQYQPGVSSRTVDVHVAWLRQKLEDDPPGPRHIQTVRAEPAIDFHPDHRGR